MALLLDSPRPLLLGEQRTLSHTGIGSSFRLDFKRDREGCVSVTSKRTPVGGVRVEDLARAVLRATGELSEEGLSSLPAASGARRDYVAAVRAFRAATGMRATGA
ncbi:MULTISPECIES: hypothetical protein [unclassified Streptomyces]|uniref:hypothetical protein n=1 Tax=unclassified Streptomyces TaxID=2593676 RepID=UPI00131DB695|nr:MULTISPECIES: hypothetical protein [unclassified Streptomyces]